MDCTELELNYTTFVRGLQKPGEDMLQSINPKQLEMLHMAVGISGEAGELLDALKKHVVYGKELDRENVIEELGDLEFYMEGLRSLVGVTRDTVVRHNIDKLRKRYGAKYSNEAAIARADKLEK